MAFFFLPTCKKCFLGSILWGYSGNYFSGSKLKENQIFTYSFFCLWKQVQALPNILFYTFESYLLKSARIKLEKSKEN